MKSRSISTKPSPGSPSLYPMAEIPEDVILRDGNLWMTLRTLARIFGEEPETLKSLVLDGIAAGEIDPDAVIKESAGTALFGLEAAISLGFRLKTEKARAFRCWASRFFSSFVSRGYAIDAERLKHPEWQLTEKNFEELIRRIREIRASDARFRRTIEDLVSHHLAGPVEKKVFAERFFTRARTLLYLASVHETPAGILLTRPDHRKAGMRLRESKDGRERRIHERDALDPARYLNSEEYTTLCRWIVMFIDYLTLQAERRGRLTTDDFDHCLTAFMTFHECQGLTANETDLDGRNAKAFALKELRLYQERELAITEVSARPDLDQNNA